MILENVSVDCVVFGFNHDKLNVLLWQAEPELFKEALKSQEEYNQLKMLFEKTSASGSESNWGLVGSFLPDDEDPDNYAGKIIKIVTGLEKVYLRQVKIFGDPQRVPFIRVLTVAYYALINPEFHDLKFSPLARAVKWFEINQLPDVFFDVKEIIIAALKNLRQEVQYHPVGFHLLPEKFTLSQLQKVYEVILNKYIDTRNFRKKIIKMRLLNDTNEKQQNVAHRAAKLYSFDLNIYHKLVEEGLNFRIS